MILDFDYSFLAYLRVAGKDKKENELMFMNGVYICVYTRWSVCCWKQSKLDVYSFLINIRSVGKLNGIDRMIKHCLCFIFVLISCVQITLVDIFACDLPNSLSIALVFIVINLSGILSLTT